MLAVIAYVGISWVYASLVLAPRTVLTAVPDIEGLAGEPVELARDEARLVGTYFAHPDPRCAVLMLHGINDSHGSVLGYGAIYYSYGCAVLAYDHRGQGRSDTRPVTYGFHEADDAAWAIDWLAQRTGLVPSAIGVHGNSLGAATALEILDRRDDLGFVVADSPYSSMEAIVAKQAGETLGFIEPVVRPLAMFIVELRADIDVDQVQPVAAVVGKRTPLLLLHSAGDRIVPPSHSEEIAASNPEIVRHLLPGSYHLSAYTVDPAGYTRLVHEFLDGRRTE